MDDSTVMDPEAPQQESAVQELARDDNARRRFLKMAGGTGAASGLALLIAACGGSSNGGGGGSQGQSGGGQTTTSASGGGSSSAGDLKIVNYALTLEYLEAQFYKEVVDSGLFKSSKYLDTIKRFGQEEAEHVGALKQVAQSLGKPAPKPNANFKSVLKDANTVLQTAATVENLGASAYLGQAGNIKSKKILAAALAIHTVEARHAAVLNTLIGKTPTPDGAFGKPASMSQVLPKVKPFLA